MEIFSTIFKVKGTLTVVFVKFSLSVQINWDEQAAHAAKTKHDTIKDTYK